MLTFVSGASLATVIASLVAAGASLYGAIQARRRWGTDRLDNRIKAAEGWAMSGVSRSQLYGVGVLRSLFEGGELDDVAKRWVAASLDLLQPPLSEAGDVSDTDYEVED